MKLREVHLLASDVDAALRFYRDTLKLDARITDGDVHVIVGGVSQLVFHRAPEGWHGVHHFAFNVPEAQFAGAKAWLMQRMLLHRDATGVDEFFFADWNAHAAYFFDPLGNIVEIIARHTLPDDDVRPFSSAGLRCISEIGLPVEDVRRAVPRLCDEASTNAYRGPGSDEFAAVGDEHGLLIVVRCGRLWFPDTGIAAQAVPLRILIELPDGSMRDVALGQ